MSRGILGLILLAIFGGLSYLPVMLAVEHSIQRLADVVAR